MDAIELNLEEFLNLSPVQQNEQHSEQSVKYIEQYVEQNNDNHPEKNVE